MLEQNLIFKPNNHLLKFLFVLTGVITILIQCLPLLAIHKLLFAILLWLLLALELKKLSLGTLQRLSLSKEGVWQVYPVNKPSYQSREFGFIFKSNFLIILKFKPETSTRFYPYFISASQLSQQQFRHLKRWLANQAYE